MLRREYWRSIATLAAVVFAASVVAGQTAEVAQALRALTNALPPAWTVARVETNQVPYGHHWDENYTGPKGLLVVAKGTRAVHAEFTSAGGKSRVVRVATEALDIWLMPSNYHNSCFAWLSFHRPVQPTILLDHGPVQLYAEPSHVLLSEKDFDDLVSRSSGTGWVDSPGDSPALLTWKNWRATLKAAIKQALAK